MDFVYSAVAHSDTILVQYANATSNFDSTLVDILSRISTNETRFMTTIEYHTYYVLNDPSSKLFFAAVCSSNVGSNAAYTFLEELKFLFITSIRLSQELSSFMYQQSFSPKIKKLLDKYNSKPDTDIEDSNNNTSLSILDAELDPITNGSRSNDCYKHLLLSLIIIILIIVAIGIIKNLVKKG